MGQTRMFRDRVVSMEQTLEGGEKHLPLLKAICAEALPDLVLREHSLDHERDMFVMDFDAPDGTRQRVSWTRMVLFDAERIPTLTTDPAAALRAKIIEHIRAQIGRPEILVTFRHLEEGWVDTPEPRRDSSRRRRRGGRGVVRGKEPGAQDKRPGGQPQQRDRTRDRDRRPAGGPPGAGAPQQRGPAAPQPQRRPPAPGPGPAPEAGQGAPGAKRRRRRRRRGRGPGGGPGGPPGGAPPPPAGPRP